MILTPDQLEDFNELKALLDDVCPNASDALHSSGLSAKEVIEQLKEAHEAIKDARLELDDAEFRLETLWADLGGEEP